ncbi:AGR376Wp [Eremothecium gossypii ATCC 10895]|uniref:AGR376Wp n=1 Tax=Eremothecium gossypii (strain ATCC 10895 / CBS 109.51 / FGSC 9923 / NRRL Y-1056) TaxID=284811 RepID=Q74Z30_EREGS|nr:AGR376Wp [Eremothecium gossypii ATCC 10895]AAS54866.2 AGR376Wp [Eremothecium gossypii ATCC 10895]AEY99198.1 FAGR376Wp [Eremothecium gossypii FDAG1]
MNVFVGQAPCDTVIGIDRYSFTLRQGQPFHGFKAIPRHQPFHVIHFQHGEDGVRYGYWLSAADDSYIALSYSADQEQYVPEEQPACEPHLVTEKRLAACQQLMVSYPKVDEDDMWHQLTQYMRWADMRRWVDEGGSGAPFAYVDSSVTTAEENSMLNAALARTPSTRPRDCLEQHMLRYTPIHFKSTAAIRPDHRMQDYLDRSFYLNHVILPHYHDNSFASLLGELQFAFLNAMLFCNYGSSLQWHALVELVCTASCVTAAQLAQLDALLAAQLDALPAEYHDSLLNEQVWLRCVLTDGPEPPAARLPRAAHRAAVIFPDDPGSDASAEPPDSDDSDGPAVAGRVSYGPRASSTHP